MKYCPRKRKRKNAKVRIGTENDTDLWNLFTFQVVILEHLDLTNESINDEKKLFTITDGFAPHAAAYIEQLNKITEH